MSNEFPPLFIQTSQYAARADRLLIGGMLWPSVSEEDYLLPRGGVRPHGVDLEDDVETSLLVTAGTGLNVTVAVGSAFVPATLYNQGLSGIYLVAVTTPQTVNVCAVYAAATYKIVLKVVDPEAGDEGEPEWQIVSLPQADPMPAASLHLANVTVPASSGALTITDMRSWTAASGGMLPIRTKVLDIDGGGGALLGAPYGSQAFAIDEGLTYLRTKNRGWITPPVVVDAGVIAPYLPRVGELYWKAASQDLQICSAVTPSEKWVSVGPGLATKIRSGQATTYSTGTRIVTTTPSSDAFIVAPKTAGAWYLINHADLVAKFSTGKPAIDTLTVRIKVEATSAPVSICLSACVEVHTAAWDGEGDTEAVSTTRGAIGIQVASVPVDPEDVEETGADMAWEDTWMNNGMMWMGRWSGFQSRTFYKNIGLGEYKIRPVFGADVLNENLVISALSIQVITL